MASPGRAKAMQESVQSIIAGRTSSSRELPDLLNPFDSGDPDALGLASLFNTPSGTPRSSIVDLLCGGPVHLAARKLSAVDVSQSLHIPHELGVSKTAGACFGLERIHHDWSGLERHTLFCGADFKQSASKHSCGNSMLEHHHRWPNDNRKKLTRLQSAMNVFKAEGVKHPAVEDSREFDVATLLRIMGDAACILQQHGVNPSAILSGFGNASASRSQEVPESSTPVLHQPPVSVQDGVARTRFDSNTLDLQQLLAADSQLETPSCSSNAETNVCGPLERTFLNRLLGPGKVCGEPALSAKWGRDRSTSLMQLLADSRRSKRSKASSVLLFMEELGLSTCDDHLSADPLAVPEPSSAPPPAGSNITCTAASAGLFLQAPGLSLTSSCADQPVANTLELQRDVVANSSVMLSSSTIKGGDQRKINIHALQQVYHLPINEAAEQLGVGVTVLKKYCRKFDIPRWPYRKLKSMDKLIQSVEECSHQDPATALVVLTELRGFKELIYADPCVDIEERIKKLRQANFKMEYKQRQLVGVHST